VRLKMRRYFVEAIEHTRFAVAVFYGFQEERTASCAKFGEASKSYRSSTSTKNHTTNSSTVIPPTYTKETPGYPPLCQPFPNSSYDLFTNSFTQHPSQKATRTQWASPTTESPSYPAFFTLQQYINSASAASTNKCSRNYA
jgi:hypothetical protein